MTGESRRPYHGNNYMAGKWVRPTQKHEATMYKEPRVTNNHSVRLGQRLQKHNSDHHMEPIETKFLVALFRYQFKIFTFYIYRVFRG